MRGVTVGVGIGYVSFGASPSSAVGGAAALVATSSEEERPWMIVHVGPPKTGTTTTQGGLEKTAPTLAGKDNIFFLGAQQGNAQQQRAHFPQQWIEYFEHNMTTTKGCTSNTQKLPVFPMQHILPNEGSTEKHNLFHEAAKDHRQQKRNVVISSEHFTSKGGGEREGKGRGKGKKGGKKRTGGGVGGEARKDVKEGKNDDELSLFFERVFDRVFLQDVELDSQLHRTPKELAHQLGNRSLNDVDRFRFGFDIKVVVTYRHLFQSLTIIMGLCFRISCGPPCLPCAIALASLTCTSSKS
jgi:hypothetical protein